MPCTVAIATWSASTSAFAGIAPARRRRSASSDAELRERALAQARRTGLDGVPGFTPAHVVLVPGVPQREIAEVEVTLDGDVLVVRENGLDAGARRACRLPSRRAVSAA